MGPAIADELLVEVEVVMMEELELTVVEEFAIVEEPAIVAEQLNCVLILEDDCIEELLGYIELV